MDAMAVDSNNISYEKRLPETDIGRAAALAAEAFEDTASFAYIFPGPGKERIAFLKWLFECNFKLLSWHQDDDNCCDGLLRCAYAEYNNNDDDETTNSNKELVSFFCLFDSSMPRPGLWEMLKAGVFAGVFAYGLGTMQRMMATKDWFDERYQQVIGDRHMLLLERMTVLPKWQGKGIGSKALGKALEDAADKAQLPCVLATQSARNVAFYKRLGFAVVDDSNVPEELGGYRNWIMKREPVLSGEEQQQPPCAN